jgi:thioredoxin reductase
METDVAIIGAGPYGLAIGAHLRAAGVDFQIFGRPMGLWRHHMPEGMLLKSDGFASNLYDANGEFTLGRYCREHAIDYSDDRIPVRLDTFVDYGIAFKNRLVPNVDETLVETVQRSDSGFALKLANGRAVKAKYVVSATGIQHFRYLPEQLQPLSPEFASHSYDHHDLSPLAGKRIAVIGGGASAIDLAGLLKSRGCDVRIICRREKLRFADPPPLRRSLWRRLRQPSSGIGPGLKSRFCTDAPLVFHFLPEGFRQDFVRRHLGPAAGWPMKELVLGRVPVLNGHELLSATIVGGSVDLKLCHGGNESTSVRVDHVIAATGYRVDISRLNYLDKSLVEYLEHVNQTPILSTRFESSIKGLFFTGPIAANSFGPLMRFAFGAAFACNRIVPRLTRLPRLAASKTQEAII